jgi:hypothetical protein
MPDLETIVAAYFDPAIMPAFSNGRRLSWSLVGRRLFLARGPSGEFEMFLEGALSSFGPVQTGPGFEWNTYHEPGGMQIDALCLRLPNDAGNARLVAHLAYEAQQRLLNTPSISNVHLLDELQPYLALLRDRGLLTIPAQQGLLGELLLVERLLHVARTRGLPDANALDAWKGWAQGASRDFSRNGSVVEVKTTSSDQREHSISSIEQLELGAGENLLHIYSLSLKPDPSGALQLWLKADSIAASLESTDRALFESQLRSAGYELAYAQQYRLAPCFVTTRFVAGLYPVTNVLSRLRLTSFVGGQLPQNVGGVTYMLSLQNALAVPAGNIDSILASLVS